MRISVGVVILGGVLLAAVVTHLRHHKHVELLTVPTNVNQLNAIGHRDLRKAQQLLRASLLPSKMSSIGQKAPEMMLHGIGGLGAGEEDENEKDWEVSMHLDSGCSEHLKARSEGNPGWKRLPSVTCIPNKVQNPMMWPFDAPGKTWLHDSTDSSKDGDHWPYKETDLRDFVESAPPSPAWADGIWRDQDPPVGSMPADDDVYWDQFDRAGDAPPGHGSAAAASES